MRCGQCDTDNRAGRRFCAACGAALGLACSACGFENEAGDRFCGGCGRALAGNAVHQGPAPDYEAQRHDAAEPERRQLTVMFCDLVDSTVLAEQLDPEDLREIIREYQQVCVSVIERFEGYVARFMGDGIMVYFGYPEAHEDDSERAVRAGLDITNAMARTSFRSPDQPGPRTLSVRIGIATGRVVVGDLIGTGAAEEKAVVGETPNMAARIQSVAHPGDVLVGEATHRLVRDQFEFSPLGAQSFKGFRRPVPVFRALRPSDVPSRFEATARRGLTPLVGRQTEIGRVLSAWESAKDGRGRVMLISGEAGIGKSRLVRRVRTGLEGERPQETAFHCSPYHRHSALHPLVEQIRRECLPADDDPADSRAGPDLDVLGAWLAGLGVTDRDAPLVVGALLSVPGVDLEAALGLNPAQAREKTLETLAGMFETRARRTPMLAVIEDAHWVDPSTLELVERVVLRVDRLPALVLITARPEFEFPWSSLDHVTEIALDRLDAESMRQLVAGVGGGWEPPPEVVAHIVEKAGGVPLYAEEITKTILESGAIGAQLDDGAAVGLSIPSTLQDSLMARLDRLSTVKEVAQLASVVGRVFDYELVRELWGRDPVELDVALGRLAEAALISERRRAGEREYEFKHALVQEAAYESLLRRTRQDLHERIAVVLERWRGDGRPIEPELLAHHLTEAGDAARGIGYWREAGERAIARAAMRESIGHIRRGLDLVDALADAAQRDREELGLRLDLGYAFRGAKGFAAAEAGEAWNRARELCRKLDDVDALGDVLRGLWGFHYVRGELTRARALAEELIDLARRTGDPDAAFVAHYTLGSNLFWLGEFAPARADLETAMATQEPSERRSVASAQLDPGVMTLDNLAWSLWFLGEPEGAAARAAEALALARELAHPFTLGAGLVWAGFVHASLGDWPTVRRLCGEVEALNAEHEIAYWPIIGRVLQGRACFHVDDREAGIALMRDGVGAYRGTGSGVVLAYLLAVLAEALAEHGEPAEAVGLVDEALAVAERNREGHWMAELHRLRGRLAAILEPDTGSAVAHLERAADRAREQGAVLLELRALTDLVGHGADAGRRDRLAALAALPACAGSAEAAVALATLASDPAQMGRMG